MKYSGHRKLLCELPKFLKFNAFILLGFLFTNCAQRELFSICTQSIRNCNYLSLFYNLGKNNIVRDKNPRKGITKCRILEPEQTYLSSSPLYPRYLLTTNKCTSKILDLFNDCLSMFISSNFKQQQTKNSSVSL